MHSITAKGKCIARISRWIRIMKCLKTYRGCQLPLAKIIKRPFGSLQFCKTCLCFIQTYTIYLIQKPVKLYHSLLLFIPYSLFEISPSLCIHILRERWKRRFIHLHKECYYLLLSSLLLIKQKCVNYSPHVFEIIRLLKIQELGK